MQGYFDGGAKGNPGIAGAGWVIYDAFNNIVMCGTVYVGDYETNNTSEYQGLIHLLEYAKSVGITEINIYGDSKLVIQQVQNRFKCNQPHLILLRDKARALMDSVECRFTHVPRALNAVADKLSNIAMKNHETKIGLDLLE